MNSADARWLGCFLAGFAVGLTVWFSSIVDSMGERSYDFGARAMVLVALILIACGLALIGKLFHHGRGWLAPVLLAGTAGVVMPLAVTLVTLTTNGFSA